MEKIISTIYMEGVKIDKIKYVNKNKHVFLLDNGIEILRKDIKNIDVKCDCGYVYNLKCFSNRLINKKWSCRSCRVSGGNNPMYGKKMSEKEKKKKSKSMMGKKNHFYGKRHKKQFKEKLSKERRGVWCVGENNPMYGKNVYDILVEKYGDEISNKMWSEKSKRQSILMSGENNPMFGVHLTGRTFTLEHRKNLRLSTIKRISENMKNGYQLIPAFNKNSCLLFDKISNSNDIFIQHAMNGGEYFIKELGYWLDGYDKNNNVVYEFDEKRHFDIDGNLLEKDIIRQSEIVKKLKCKFIRIKYDEIQLLEKTNFKINY